MPDDASKVTCEEFQNQLGELIGSGVDVANHPHAKACALCGGLIRELYRFAQHFQPGINGSDPDDWSEST